MMRNYALTFLAVTSRIAVPLLLLAQVPFSDSVEASSIGEDITDMIPIGQIADWIINLTIAEIMIRRRRARLPAPA